MSGNRKRMLCFALIACVAFSVICSGIYFYLPVLIENRLLPRFARSFGFPDYTGDVRNLSLGGMDLASLRFGERENPALQIDSVRFDYSVSGLWRKHIDRIIISGVDFRVLIKNGRFTIPLLERRGYPEDSPVEERTPPYEPKGPVLPFRFGECKIRNASIVIEREEKVIKVPLEINLKPSPLNEDGKFSGYDVTMRLFHHGETVHLRCHVNPVEGDIGCDVLLADFDLLRFAGLTGLLPGLNIVASGNIRAALDFNKKEFKIIPFITNANLAYKEMQMGLKRPVSLPFVLKMSITKKGQWQFDLESLLEDDILLVSPQKGELTLHPVSFSAGGGGAGKGGTVRFSMKLSRVRYTTDAIKGNVSACDIFAEAIIDKFKIQKIRAFAKIADAEIDTGKVYAGKIKAGIPFQWPCFQSKGEDIKPEVKEVGYCYLDEVKLGTVRLGRVSARVQQQPGCMVLFDGDLGGIFPETPVEFTVEAGLLDEKGFTPWSSFKIFTTQEAIAVNIGKIFPELRGMSFHGHVDLQGNCGVKEGVLQGNAGIAIRNSKIEIAEGNLLLDGVSLDLKIQDLFGFRSSPGQVFKFQRLVWGDIETGDGEVRFMIESPDSFFLESMEFSWCEGHVYTGAVHVEAGKKEYNFMLFCDRLKLATILKQFNAAVAEGEGAVNGRIPISLKDGKIKIFDGFLYSTPGEGGAIQIDMEKLASRIPAFQQKHIQMEIAREALKNFRYNWAKLSLNSTEDELHMLLQLDGKPENLLPFGFNNDKGLYKTEGKRKARFKGIRFDINFKLPLDEMLYYSKGIHELIKGE